MAASSLGALLTARVPEPAVDLALLVEHLAGAVPTGPATSNQKSGAMSWPLLNWSPDGRVLGINTLGTLARLRAAEAVRKVLSQRFIVNAPIPRSAARAHLGGQITADSEARLRTNLDRLTSSIDQEIDRAIEAGFDPTALVTGDAAALLDQLAEQLNVKPEDRLQGPTRIARTLLTAVGQTRDARREEVARYLAAIEQVAGTRADHVAHFLQAVETLMRQQSYPDRTIRAALALHEQQAVTTGTQLNRFFDFLDNDALARVRTQVGVRMMESIATEAGQRDAAHPDPKLRLLTAYARRASELLVILARTGLPVNLSAVYGKQANLDLATHTSTASFVSCLPVWPEWGTQMFEEQLGSSSPGGGSVVRELTYRFRVNGAVPRSRQDTAFEHRLRRMQDRWLQLGALPHDLDLPTQRVPRSLAELVFLWAAIPSDLHTSPSGTDALAALKQLVERLEDEGRPALVAALTDLRSRVNIVNDITQGLIGLLKTQGPILLSTAMGRTWTYYINVLRDIVDMQRIANSDRALVCSASPGQEQIDFLRHLRVTADRSVYQALLSIEVRVRLSECSLQLSGEQEIIALARRRPDHLAQVVWRPYALANDTWLPALPPAKDGAWLVPGRIEIQYSPTSLRWPPGRAKDRDGLQLLAATRAALAVLVYITLFRLIQRSAADGRPSISMLRLQQAGPEADHFSGEQSVYAAAQAVELVLGRDADLRMQGIVLDDSPTEQYKTHGTYAALFAGFALQVAEPSAERPTVGLISFAARPANHHPDLPDAPGNQLVLSRTYLATSTHAPFAGYTVHAEASRTEIVAPDTALPRSVESEIERLHTVHGCQHVILLQHRFGQRRVGSHAAHTRLRHQDRLIEYLLTGYPDLVVYPLVRDTFSATRLRTRSSATEDAFEILRPDEHFGDRDGDAQDDVRRLRREYTPVYSLATLHVVGGAVGEAAKPQSGFCTYFLLRDNQAPVEPVEQMRANLLLSTSKVRPCLISVLRSIHYLEAERSVGPRSVQPVLDPYDWMAPDNTGKIGEVLVFEPNRQAHGSVSLSLTALLHRVSEVAHAQPRAGTSAQRG